MTINLKITSWNINGIKSLKCSMKSILDNLGSDIICFQEIKSTKDTIDCQNAIVDGFNSYFSFCQTKPGYSGVSFFCRNPVVPISIAEGLVSTIKRLSLTLTDEIAICEKLNISIEDLNLLESEGRALCGEFLINNCKCEISSSNHSLWIINVYCPMAEPENIERLHYKKLFNQLISLTLKTIIDNKNHVLLVGDLNITHKLIDRADPDPRNEFFSNYNRHWFDNLLIESQRYKELFLHKSSNKDDFYIGIMIDTFRYLYPSDTDSYSCWNTKIGARQTNFGSRIDYILCDQQMAIKSPIHETRILTDVYGSDHCPITTTFTRMELVPALQIPSLCSRNLTKFRNQSKITSFVLRTEKTTKRPRSPDSNQIISLAKTVKVSSMKPNDSINADASIKWKSILKGPPKPPLCGGHKIPSVYRTVIKEGPNKGKGFWVCSKPKGLPNHPDSRCNFFQWTV